MNDLAALKLSSHFVAAEALSIDDRRVMYDIYHRYYDATSQARFAHDLSEKDVALLMRNAAGQLKGFSTLKVWEKTHEGRPIRVLYSGDTIIEREYWGTQALSFNWIRYAGRIKSAAPTVPLYWFLIVKGHRTYRYLPTFANEFYPDWRRPPSDRLKKLADAFAAERFADDYDARSGVVRFDQSRGQLAICCAAPSERETARPDVSYFLQRNPGYVNGDELVCVCELSSANLRPVARRVFMQGFGE